MNALKLAPNRVWRTYLGGRTLDEIEGRPAPADSHFPEDWLVSTTRAVNIGREEIDEGVSRVEYEGRIVPLTELVAARPGEVFAGDSAGFLLKYLDAAIRLHMQCHPTAEFSAAHLNSPHGKTEGYYILGVRPGCEGYVYLGFQRPVGREAFRDAVVRQDTEALLAGFDKVPVKPGDCFLVPGGIPHAIGEGVFMVEMMEPSDFAVRVEFERGGYVVPEAARFMGRDVDFALSMFDFTARSPEETRKAFFVEPRIVEATSSFRVERLFDHPCFRSARLTLREGRYVWRQDDFTAAIVLAGEGTVGGLPAKKFDRFLLPRSMAAVEFSGRGLEVLLARAGRRKG